MDQRPDDVKPLMRGRRRQLDPRWYEAVEKVDRTGVQFERSCSAEGDRPNALFRIMHSGNARSWRGVYNVRPHFA